MTVRSLLTLHSEMQGELPLWSSGLEGLGYSDPFPKFSPKATPSYDIGRGYNVSTTFELDGSEEEKGWKFYIGSICNRRTTNDLLADMWRHGEKGWTQDIPDLLRRTGAAEHVVRSWYEYSNKNTYGPANYQQGTKSPWQEFSLKKITQI